MSFMSFLKKLVVKVLSAGMLYTGNSCILAFGVYSNAVLSWAQVREGVAYLRAMRAVPPWVCYAQLIASALYQPMVSCTSLYQPMVSCISLYQPMVSCTSLYQPMVSCTSLY